MAKQITREEVAKMNKAKLIDTMLGGVISHDGHTRRSVTDRKSLEKWTIQELRNELLGML